MDTVIVVEKGVLPPLGRRRYPFEGMELNDSFYVPDVSYQGMWNICLRASKRLGMRFTVRRDGEGVRVWRVE